MSQNIDDSPNSDNKMDISEPTTISQESIGFSPETERNSLITQTESVKQARTTNNTSLNNKMRTSNKYSGSDQHDNKFVDNNTLDNRNLINKISMSKQRASLTQVDQHPLMVPPSKCNDDDDDDENLSPDSSILFDGADTFQDFMETEINDQIINGALTKRFDLLDLPKRTNIDDKHFISSEDGESEPDISQYQASVEPTFQSVSLTNFNVNKITTHNSSANKSNNLRKIPLTNELKLMATHEDSSVETISNNSFDDDADEDDDDGNVGFHFKQTKSNTQQQQQPKQSNNGDDNDDEDDDVDINVENNENESILNVTNNDGGGGGQQTTPVVVTLSNGQTRDIDMKVIEPYKRCLSHGGYIKSPGHNAIVIFSACYLPDRSRTDYHYVMENLFLYVIKTLDQFVTEDYILIYLHGGSTRNTVPPLPWLKKCYHLLDRRIRKSLKNLYMVHPTFWLKSIVWMARPFISSKFWRKLVYIRTLDDLYQIIPVEKAAVPDKVKLYDKKHS